MRTILGIVLFSLLASSCSVQKRAARFYEKYPPEEKVRVDSFFSVEYRDTTIYVDIPGDSVKEFIEIPCDPDPGVLTSISADVELAHAEARIEAGRLYLEVFQHQRVLQFKIDSAIQANYRIDSIIVERPYPVEVEKNPKRYKFFRNGFFVSMAFNVCFLLFLIITLLQAVKGGWK